MDLTIITWNVRGLNSDKKQKFIKFALEDQRVDLALLNETRLKTQVRIDGYHAEQTLNSKTGGCLTLSNLAKHWRVKSLGNYLNWTRVQLGQEWIHVLNVYIEPGFKEHVVKRAERMVAMVKDITR